jgi:hypothetical protein
MIVPEATHDGHHNMFEPVSLDRLSLIDGLTKQFTTPDNQYKLQLAKGQSAAGTGLISCRHWCNVT